MRKKLRSFLYLLLSLLVLATAVSCTADHYPDLEENFSPTGKRDDLKQDSGNNNDYELLESEQEKHATETKTMPEKEKGATLEKPGTIPPELLQHKPNELGEVMILMYHEIGYPESAWRRTPENFRLDLENLYEQGYRAISLMDLVRGNIDIPAGTSPVVLTFDDGNKGNFYYLENNGELELAPDCAVAIMEKFYQEKPDFGLAATFFIYYPNPFRQTQYIEKKLNYLAARGFEIGNHTFGHTNLAQLNASEIQRELAQHVQATQEYLPGYEVNSLALPYGGFPRENQELLLEGSYEGVAYRNEAVLLVGSNPGFPPFHQKFNRSRIPRIRASELETDGVGMYDWLEYFRQNPHKRYISDGDPHYVTAPETLREFLHNEGLKDKEARFYLN